MSFPPLSVATRTRVERLLLAGKLTYEVIADRCGVSMGSVSKIARRVGVSGRKQAKTNQTRRTVHGEVKAGGSFREIGKRIGVPARTVADHAARPIHPDDDADDRAGAVELPDGYRREGSAFAIDTPGRWLILSDIHLPSHDRPALELAVAQARRDGVAGVLLNGDTVDAHELSDHDKDPSAPRYVAEVEMGVKFLAWLRDRLPHARIVFKHGNHDERVDRYVFSRAPALFGLEGLTLRSLLKMDEFGVEEVRGRRVIRMGKLNVVHGHEYRGGGGVNPARWLYLKARSVAMTGHFHRTSEHHAKDISGRHEAAWSTGCLCDLSPLYLPLNEWSHGFAVVDIEGGGQFSVRNMRIINGEVV